MERSQRGKHPYSLSGQRGNKPPRGGCGCRDLQAHDDGSGRETENPQTLRRPVGTRSLYLSTSAVLGEGLVASCLEACSSGS